MLVSTAIQKVYLLATGKTTTLTVGTAKYTKILALLNFYKDVWAQEPGIQWNSLRSLEQLTTVSATDTYDLPDEIVEGTWKLSTQEGDYVRVVWTGGTQESSYTLVDDQKLYRDGPSVNNPGSIGINTYGNVARRGTNLVFDVPFISTSPEKGGAIYLPVYITPDDYTDGANEITIDDPYWIIFMAAAEYVRNDVTKQNQYANLVAQAVNSMNAMKENNESQIEESYVVDFLSNSGETW